MTDPSPRARDPLGKAALFSSAATIDAAADADEDAGATPQPAFSQPVGRGAAQLFSAPEARAGTLVLDCASCNRRTRVTYLEFAALHLPVWLWVPLPGRGHRHFLRCPSCNRRAWLQAHWLE